MADQTSGFPVPRLRSRLPGQTFPVLEPAVCQNRLSAFVCASLTARNRPFSVRPSGLMEFHFQQLSPGRYRFALSPFRPALLAPPFSPLRVTAYTMEITNAGWVCSIAKCQQQTLVVCALWRNVNNKRWLCGFCSEMSPTNAGCVCSVAKCHQQTLVVCVL